MLKRTWLRHLATLPKSVGESSLPSQAFLESLAAPSVAPAQQTNSDRVRFEIDRLVKRKKYDSLLSLLAKWTALEHDWQNTLQHRELSAILKHVVKYQIGVIQDAAASKSISGGVQSAAKMAHARSIREGLRKVYANILSEGQHLYSKGNLPFQLSTGDVENLVMLELNNGKLDLASRWFQALEQQYPHGHYEKMNYALWLLKFQVYGGSKSSLWKINPSRLYEKKINPRRSNLKSEMTWTEIFNDFVKNQGALLGSARAVFDKRLVCEILYSVAHNGNVQQLHKLVELNWGITSKGKMAKTFSKPTLSDPLYPDIYVLQAVVISMLYNKEYVSSLTYINAFQNHYAIDVAQKKAKLFWDQLFRWSELTTRFSEFRALHQYVKETNVKSLLGPSDAAELSVTLEEAKNLADFNYEGYLQYIADLSAQRSGLVKELWRCYLVSGMEFSVRPYQTLLTLASESRCEDDCYDLLRHLRKQSDIYNVPEDSFNFSMTLDKVGKIRGLYSKTMKLLLNIKGESAKMGTIPHIVREWSLDEGMKSDLEKWVSRQEKRYLEALYAETQKAQEEEEEFLGLL